MVQCVVVFVGRVHLMLFDRVHRLLFNDWFFLQIFCANPALILMCECHTCDLKVHTASVLVLRCLLVL